MSQGDFDSLFSSFFESELDSHISSTGSLQDPEVYKGSKLPVDIIQFVEDPYYLGGQVKLQPNVKQILWDIEDPSIREVDIQVGKGSGKSEVCSCTQCYGTYILTCLRTPHKFFNIANSAIIASVNVSIGRLQAKDVVFQGVKGKIESSPYFQKLGFNALTYEIVFPNNIKIYCGHSADRTFLGFATFRGVMDEVNKMFDNQNRNVAKALYGMLSGSMETRFPNHYKLVAVSSTTLPTTWLNTRMNQAIREGDQYQSRLRFLEMEIIEKYPDGSLLVRVSVDPSMEGEPLEDSLAREGYQLIRKINDSGELSSNSSVCEVRPKVISGL